MLWCTPETNPTLYINYTPVKLEKSKIKPFLKGKKKALCSKRLLVSKVSQGDMHGRAASRMQGAELTHSLLLSEEVSDGQKIRKLDLEEALKGDFVSENVLGEIYLAWMFW